MKNVLEQIGDSAITVVISVVIIGALLVVLNVVSGYKLRNVCVYSLDKTKTVAEKSSDKTS